MPTNDPAFTRGLQGEPPPIPPPRRDRPPPRGGADPRWPAGIALAGAVVGAFFSGLSTTDFAQHLDRQVHAIHCSFLPGAAKEIAESGCRTVMMSPYSSFFRETLWGGIPVSLWALAVFTFLAYRFALVLWRGRTSAGEAKVLALAAALPVAMSVGYGTLSVVKLDALCKVCIGIYGASAVAFAGALLGWRAARGAASSPGGARLVTALVEGTALVAAVTIAYLALVPRPDPKTSMLGCGALVRPDDAAGVVIPLAPHPQGVPSIEVLDPLCPSCKAFDQRLAASSFGDRLDLRAVLFPLDSSCNWMVTEAIHPGACAVSEAVLCAAGLGPGPRNGEAAVAVVRWAFERQSELRAMAAKDDRAVRAEIERAFPAVKGCLGGALVRNKLGKSLRWAVANAIPVLTPQLFVNESRVCDEDTDLGLEYTLARMLSPEAEQARARERAAHPPPPQPPPELAQAVPAAAPEGGGAVAVPSLHLAPAPGAGGDASAHGDRAPREPRPEGAGAPAADPAPRGEPVPAPSPEPEPEPTREETTR